MKLGYSTWGMITVPIDPAVEHIAGLGFDTIEIAVGPRWTTDLDKMDAAERKRIPQLVKNHGLEISAIDGHVSLLETDGDALAKNVARLNDAIDLAVQWAQGDTPPYVCTLSGGAPEDWDSLHEMFAERLANAVKYAEQQGVTLAMEPHVGGLVDTPERMLAILDLVRSPNLRVNFDISHFDVLGIPNEESIRALIDYSVHTHVKDQRGRYPDHEFRIPGEGPFDYVEYLRLMRKYGYDGVISAEVSIMVQKRPDYDPFAAAELSYRTLSRAFEEAGIERS
jgi:sugar phosphate isomerase/epimerase